MDLSHGEAIDSLCRLCRAEGEKSEAVDWATGSDGRRYYVCAEHAEQLARFGRDLDDLPETPHAQPCNACNQLTLTEDLNPATKRCPECEGPEAVAHTLIDEDAAGMSAEEALEVMDTLVEEGEEDVDPERAAEALEQMTGIPMEPAEETEEEDAEA